MRDVYLFPGIIGSDFQLTQIIKNVPDINSTRLMSYPDARSLTELIVNIHKISKHFAENIIAENSGHDVVIIGYSFGGCIALEVGSLLRKSGLSIDNIFVIDAPIPGMTFDFDLSQRLGVLVPRTGFKQAKVRAMEFMCFNRKARLLILHCCRVFNYRDTKKLERFIVRSLRERGRRDNWTPVKVEFSGLLFFSKQFEPLISPVWREMCPNMPISVIDTEHLQLLKNSSLSNISDCISSHLLTSQTA